MQFDTPFLWMAEESCAKGKNLPSDYLFLHFILNNVHSLHFSITFETIVNGIQKGTDLIEILINVMSVFIHLRDATFLRSLFKMKCVLV